MYIKRLALLILLFCICESSIAKENVGVPSAPKRDDGNSEVMMDCNQSTAQIDLAINNVRARMLTGGDLWWDPVGGNPHYEVPRVPPGSDQPSVHSIFAGALWIGGIDQLNQLKVAAQTYRQTGNDFWPGPLDDNGEVITETCNAFDRFWSVLGRDIDDYLGKLEAGGGTVSVAEIPEGILQWPAKDNPYFTAFDLPEGKELAPFWDADGDEVYDPASGDYPVIDSQVEGVYADQMIWWIFNDKGNIHTETGGEAIGLEVNAMSFAFATNDEVNNMTFYKYVVDNKSTQRLDSVYFGQWVDPDLGEFNDDYVGCSPEEGLGFVYNGTASDAQYGSTPPILGVDFFRGPKKFGDFDGDGSIDTLIQGMSAFVYYNNDATVQGNPSNASHFYGYLAGVWKDGTPFTFGGNGKGGDEPTPFMFPDEPSDNEGWSECTNGNDPADRRFLQSSGPFSLEPGTVNDIIVGVVWVREGLEYPCPSLDVFLRADKKAQALFDNNFKLKDGPDAPSMTIRELDRELIITLWNDTLISNNAFERYSEIDPVLANQGFPDSTFNFQGYKLYQLSGPTVSPSEYNDPDKSRLVKVVDVKDGVTKIVNYTIDGTVGSLVPQLKVNSEDEGILHTFQITEDLFALGARQLVNNKKYYYSVVSYAYNAHEVYDPAAPSEIAQLEPYLEGRNNIAPYVGIPHKSEPENGGTIINEEAGYGSGPEVTKIQGFGNGGNALELTDATIDAIMSSPNHKVDNPTYKGAAGPIDITIFDPYSVPNHDFRLTITNKDFPTITPPANGNVTTNEDGTLTYTPNGGFEGYDYFSYEISNTDCDIDIAGVTIKVGNAQVNQILALDNTYFTRRHTGIVDAVDSTASVLVIKPLDNDFVPEGKEMTITDITTEPANGIIFAQTEDSIIYIPNKGFAGIDKFVYSIADGTQASTPGQVITTTSATVYVKVAELESEFVPSNAVDDRIDVAPNAPSNLDVATNDTGEGLGGLTLSPFARWILQDLTTGTTYKSENNIKRANEQAIGGWEGNTLGFFVNVNQVPNPSSNYNGFISANQSFTESQNRWLTLLTDGEGTSIFNWIRSGEFTGDADYNDHTLNSNLYDINQYYEEILGGQVAPYCLANNTISTTGAGSIQPACSDCGDDLGLVDPTLNLDELISAKVVLTSDKSRWSRCAIVDLAASPVISEGGATKNGLRRHASWNREVDGAGIPTYAAAMGGTQLVANSSYFVKGSSASFITFNNAAGASTTIEGNTFFTPDANANFTTSNGAEVFNASDVGYSWFPGYAINVENGERVNIIFGENSFLGGDNGKDMLWNPTDQLVSPNFGVSGNSLRIGGEHYIYVTRTLYDEGKAHHDKLVEVAVLKDRGENRTTYATPKRGVYDEVSWVTVPFITPTFALTSFDEGYIPSDMTLDINVGRSYKEPATNQPLVYDFSFQNFSTQQNNTEAAKSAMDLIRVVPNPYYAFSSYESSQLDNEVRFTNLPARVNISIMTIDGNLVRTIQVDNTGLETSLGAKAGQENVNTIDWDIKNFKGLPIASGIYLIHIEAPDLGEERTLKWFCIARPIDLDIF